MSDLLVGQPVLLIDATTASTIGVAEAVSGEESAGGAVQEGGAAPGARPRSGAAAGATAEGALVEATTVLAAGGAATVFGADSLGGAGLLVPPPERAAGAPGLGVVRVPGGLPASLPLGATKDLAAAAPLPAGFSLLFFEAFTGGGAVLILPPFVASFAVAALLVAGFFCTFSLVAAIGLAEGSLPFASSVGGFS